MEAVFKSFLFFITLKFKVSICASFQITSHKFHTIFTRRNHRTQQWGNSWLSDVVTWKKKKKKKYRFQTENRNLCTHFFQQNCNFRIEMRDLTNVERVNGKTNWICSLNYVILNFFYGQLRFYLELLITIRTIIPRRSNSFIWFYRLIFSWFDIRYPTLLTPLQNDETTDQLNVRSIHL